MGEYSDMLKAFLKETNYTKEMLKLGATEIRKANYALKGVYYEAFTCLSTGIERIGKLCLILDYYIDNSGELPSLKYLKQDFRHDLLKLYEKSKEIALKHNVSFDFMDDLDKEVYQRILKVLSDFANGDRYSNLNVLLGEKDQSDPIYSWYKDVDEYIFDNYVSLKKKEMIHNNAKAIDELISNFTMVRHLSETGEVLREVEKASFETGKNEAVAPKRQLFMLQIIRYWVELIKNLGDKARDINQNELMIPYFGEIFGGFYNSDSYFKSRKTWNDI